MNNLPDSELIRLFRESEKSDYYFRLIIEKYQEKLYWLIRRLVVYHDDTDDILQNTFVKIWKGLPGFRESSELYTWMFRIATNEAVTFLKSKQKVNSRIALDPDDLIKANLKSDPYFDGDELHLKLLGAIEKLPAKQRIVFQMKYFDDLSYEEISERLGTSVGALKASYHHAVKKLQNSFTIDD
jgi:RNA polymerase sigma-70 factor (ECF subfamily)